MANSRKASRPARKWLLLALIVASLGMQSCDSPFCGPLDRCCCTFIKCINC